MHPTPLEKITGKSIPKIMTSAGKAIGRKMVRTRGQEKKEGQERKEGQEKEKKEGQGKKKAGEDEKKESQGESNDIVQNQSRDLLPSPNHRVLRQHRDPQFSSKSQKKLNFAPKTNQKNTQVAETKVDETEGTPPLTRRRIRKVSDKLEDDDEYIESDESPEKVIVNEPRSMEKYPKAVDMSDVFDDEISTSSSKKDILKSIKENRSTNRKRKRSGNIVHLLSFPSSSNTSGKDKTLDDPHWKCNQDKNSFFANCGNIFPLNSF